MNNVIQSTLPKFQSNLSLRNSLNPFSGALSAANSDVNFEEITTGDSHEISEITAADPAVITFAGGDELHTDANAASIGSEADATTGFTSTGLAGTGSNVFESQGAVKSDGSYALHADANDTPTSAAGFYKDIGTDFGLSDGDWVTVSLDIRHVGSGGDWDVRFGSVNYAAPPSKIIDVITSADTTFEPWATIFKYDSTYQYISIREVSGTNDGGVYIDKFSVKLLHDYSADDVISIGGVESEALGSEIMTNGTMEAGDPPSNWTLQSGATLSSVADERTGGAGAASMNAVRGSSDVVAQQGRTTVVDSWYILSGWVKNVDATSCGMSVFGSNLGSISTSISASASWVYISLVFQAEDTFTALQPRVAGSVGQQGRFDDISLKLIPPVLAKPYRIDTIDANGACTLLNADFSDMAAAITSGYATSATLTNYTEGDGWMTGLDLDPTPINSGTLTLDTVYFINQLDTPNTFYSGDALGDFFTSDGTENPDATNVVMALTDTYAICDGSQSAASDLESTGASITSGKGYKSTIVLDGISAGAVTPVISTQPGAAIPSPATNVQNIKANGTDTAKIRANTAAEGVKITEWTIEQYS